MSEEKQDSTVLHIQGLRTSFFTEDGEARAVDGIHLALKQGEALALVGESGCGKTAAALSILRLLPSPQGRIVDGRILFDGMDLVKEPLKSLRRIRGNRISMIFQEPMSALNPVFTVGEQIAEALRVHRREGRAWCRREALEMLRRVGIPAPDARYRAYPHMLSGGMQQRVMIAMALACRPEVLIADEPTTAVDVTVQAQVMALLNSYQRAHRMALLLITHDLSVVSEMADRVAVMYAGRIVERASKPALLKKPRHPYTDGLFRSLPVWQRGRNRLEEIPGAVPDPRAYPAACRFHPRCPKALERCRVEAPHLRELEPGRWAACHFPC